MVIGGNGTKTVGNKLIDTGHLPIANIAQEMWRITYFASNLLVVQLASSKTVMSCIAVQ